MLLLAVDTATDQGSLALVEEDRVLGEFSLSAAGSYLKFLLPGIETLLTQTGRRLEEVEALAVSQGPGNFTGLRIGLATVQGLAWALNIPVAAVSTLEVLAAQLPFHPHPVGVLIDAKRREVYLGRYLCPEDQPQALEAPERLPLEALAARLSPPLTLTGPGLSAYEQFLRAELGPDVHFAPPEKRFPLASTLARLARGRLTEGKAVPPQALLPLYLRPAL
jgi:tRNA threonylcarbamoyladenosine biosynthesis protein TsaB|uniref:tRNA (Adenosine(37)-N6)-threonylcarbamoyltransferase complex dimerization subunit type 1 TsaB n=1 Tax=Desulfobacca acetoxidans TaxID=60893 RepID=A0A7C3WQD2_9BACT